MVRLRDSCEPGRASRPLPGGCACGEAGIARRGTACSKRGFCSERGQATIEAVAVIPVLFVLLLMLIQPAIVLYDRMVMGGAAAEGCRLLATKTSALGAMDGSCEAFIRHRLASIPQHECFHVHGDGCSWVIECSGDEGDQTVSVRIANELRPLPLFDAGSALLGMTNGAGNLVIEEEVVMRVQPDWVASSEHGLSPSDWIGAWES